MAKVVLNDVTNFADNSTAVVATDANNAAIEAAMENTLSLDGTAPNSMGADLDLNSNKVINLDAPSNASDAATKDYVDTMQVTPPDAVVSTYGATLIDDVNAAAARATLDAAGLTVANVFTKTQTWKHGADVASAAALTLTDGNFFHISGTTAITSIATKGIGTLVVLHFEGILTLTHHATNLILPSGENITTAVGDVIILEEYAAGQWHHVSYCRDSGQQLKDQRIWVKDSDIASATTLVLGSGGNFFDVTGTTTITGITVSAGTLFMLQFDGALTFTHGASLLLPGEANITTVAGDRAICFATAVDTVIVMSYVKVDGKGVFGVSDIQSFDASGTWTKPSFGTIAIVEGWGAGAGGGIGAGDEGSGGGGGGTYVWYAIPLADLGATESVTIGAGGTAGAWGTTTHGGVGGNSTFGAFVTAFGGGGGNGAGGRGGGGGGSPGGVGLTNSSGGAAGLFGAVASTDGYFGGGGGFGGSGHGGEAVIGGGGGSLGASIGNPAGNGGNSKIGGGGGGGSTGTGTVGPGGTSLIGGDGGDGANNSTAAVIGVQPGGGGGAGAGSGGSSAAAIGGAGRITVTVV